MEITERAVTAGRNKEDFHSVPDSGTSVFLPAATALLIRTSCCPVLPESCLLDITAGRTACLRRLTAPILTSPAVRDECNTRSHLAVVSVFGILTSWATDVP
jgi:hypothetical protein